MKKLHIGFKLAIGSAIALICTAAVSFFFVLMPIYGLVGSDQSVGVSSKLNQYETLARVLQSVNVILIIVFIVSVFVGIMHEIRKA